ASPHQIGKAQGRQGQSAVARGDAQQQVGDQGGEDLGADGVFGTAEEGADFEMLLDPAKQQFDLPALAVERGDLAGRPAQVVGQQGEQTAILSAQDDPAQSDGQAGALLRGEFD